MDCKYLKGIGSNVPAAKYEGGINECDTGMASLMYKSTFTNNEKKKSIILNKSTFSKKYKISIEYLEGPFGWLI